MNSILKSSTIILLILCSSLAFATDYYPNGNGNFEDATSWNGGTTIPSSSDDITFSWSSVSPTSNNIALNTSHTIYDFDFSNCSTMSITLSSGDGNAHILTVNNLKIETDFTLIIENNITLIVNGKTTTNGGVIEVKDGGSIQFKDDVSMGGSGATLNVASTASVDVSGTLTFSGGVNILNISGYVSMDDMVASGGTQELNILSGGVVLVRNDSSFSGSASFDITNDGTFTVGGNMSVTGGASGVIDGSLDVTGTLTNKVALSGDGTVTAGSYAGNGTLFGSKMSTLTGGVTYEDNGSNAAVPAGTLPISLLVFDANITQNGVEVIWQTATEINNHFYTIERSIDGANFEIVGTIDGAGNSQFELTYSFVDANPLLGTTYYRLKQTDYNGAFEYFDPVAVTYYNESEFQVYPNPATNQITIDFGGLSAESTIQLYSLTGQMVKSFSVWQAVQTLDVSDLASGNYILTVLNGNQPLVKRIVIQ
jgi:hypothetical protein